MGCVASHSVHMVLDMGFIGPVISWVGVEHGLVFVWGQSVKVLRDTIRFLGCHVGS